jgi:RNA polymerase sigma-70 factor, ECF subfamily
MSLNTQHIDGIGLAEEVPFNEVAFEVYFKKNYGKLCVYCKCKFDFDIESAEDIVNTSFLKLWESRKTLRADVSITSYLYTIVDNTSLNALKHEKVEQRYARELLKTTFGVVEPGSFNSIDLKELRSDINVAISELPEQMRRIFLLSRFEGLKYAEIAKLLNISIKTVETQISRALTKLREKLIGYLPFWLIIFASILQ